MGRGATSAGRHVALMRGINVGGKNKLPMKELASIFEEIGCEDVSTYIQSGNVIFTADPSVARAVPKLVAKAIHDRYGYSVPVVTRTAKALRAVARGNPFLSQGEDPAALHVVFLSSEPGRERFSSLDPERSPPDRFICRKSHIYLCCPNGVARSKLSNQYFDTRLATTSTARNWKTVLKLVDLSSA